MDGLIFPPPQTVCLGDCFSLEGLKYLFHLGESMAFLQHHRAFLIYFSIYFFSFNSLEISNSCKMGVRWKNLQSKGVNFFGEEKVWGFFGMVVGGFVLFWGRVLSFFFLFSFFFFLFFKGGFLDNWSQKRYFC